MFHMNDDYKRGLVTGLAMQPLYVVIQGGGEKVPDNFCGNVVLGDVFSDDGYCKFIEF